MAVCQLRCDKFVVFFAREECVLNLRSPGVTKDLREEIASFRKLRSFAMDQVRDQPRLNVSIMVWQLRCEKFFFSARQLYIIGLEMKPAKSSQGNWHSTQGRWHEHPPGRDLLSLIGRVQKLGFATPNLSETAVYFHEAGAVVGGKRPRGSRERAPAYVHF